MRGEVQGVRTSLRGVGLVNKPIEGCEALGRMKDVFVCRIHGGGRIRRSKVAEFDRIADLMHLHNWGFKHQNPLPPSLRNHPSKFLHG